MRPKDGKPPAQSKAGLAAMVEIVENRFPKWNEFSAKKQMVRLAANSSDDLRDFFRMVKLCISQALYQPSLPLADALLASAESDPSNDMPLRWLAAGYGYEVTGLDVRAAYQFAMEAARNVGCEGEARERIRVLVTSDASPRRMVSMVLGPDLELPES